MENPNNHRRQILTTGEKVKYISASDCPSEAELIKTYCEDHPRAFCVGGYGHMGCRPDKSKLDQYIRYDLEKHCYVRTDGKIVSTEETYCGRVVPDRMWNGKLYHENQIWNRSRLGMPDLKDGDLIIEAKGGLPSIGKVHTALGQLILYQAQDPSLKPGFLFPEIWLMADSVQRALTVMQEKGIVLIPISKTQTPQPDPSDNSHSL